MKGFLSIAAAGLMAVSEVSGHYIATTLSVGSQKFSTYQYIRKNTNNNSPVTVLSDKDLRCNVGGSTGGSTATVNIQAGSSFTFSYDQTVYHQGPVSIYMSKAPGSAASYDGSGDWFRTQLWGPKFPGGTWDLKSAYTANIPSCIPNGEYLLRIESLAIHNPGSTPQFYVSCAQINVVGGGSKTGGPTVKIPGHVKASDPGYTANIYNNFNSYTAPGPALFTC